MPPAKKTLVSKSDLGRPLPKASNSSRIRAQVTQNRNRKNCRNVAYKTHSKGRRDKKRLPPAKKTLVSKSDLGRPLPKASNSSRLRAQVTQNRNRKNCRNVAYKTHSKERDKKRLPPAKKTLVSKSDLGRPLPKASNSSRIRAQVTQNRNRKNSRNVAYKTNSKERDKKRLPPARKTFVSKSDLGRPLPKASNSSRIRAQVPQNRNRKNCRNVAYKTHSKEKDKKRLPPAKKTLVSKSDLGRPLPKASNSSRIRAQVTQNRNRKNCRNVAYKTHSKETDKKRLTPAKKTLVSKSDLGRPLPKASNSRRIRAQVTQNRNRKNSRNVAYKTHSKETDKKRLPPAKETLVSKSDLGRPLPKASNSSRIRAQVTQNRNRKNCRNVAYKTHSKERDKKRLTPAKKTLVSKSDLGRPLPKASNSSRIRAQVSRIRAQVTQNHNVAYRTTAETSLTNHSKERDKKRIPPAKKTLVSKSDLGRPLPKASNSSRIRAQVTQNQEKIASSQENSKKRFVSKSDLGRPLPKASNSSRIRAQVTQNRNRKNCRNVAYKTHSKERDKKRLPPAKKTLVSKSDLGRPLPKASNSSRIRAQVTRNRKPQKLPQRRIQNPFKRERDKKRLPPAKKTLVSKSDLGRPLPKASNSSRIRAQVTQNRKPQKLPQRRIQNPLKRERDKKRLPPAKKTLVSKSDLGRPLPKASNSSRIRAQVTQNRKPQKLPKRRIQNPLKRKRQVSKSDLGRPLPKASNSSRIRAQVPQNRNRKNCRNVAYKTHSKEKDKKRLPPAKKTLVSKSDLGRPLPKASNSSRIRAQVTQNRNRKNCRNVAYKTHSKERDKKRLTPAKKTLVSKSDLGRPLPKASNSSRIRAQVSRIRAQVTQNRNRQKCRNVAYRTHSKERDKKRIPPAKKTLVSKSDLGRPLPKASNSSRIRAQVTRNQEKSASSKENLSLEI